ncbi:hypothetical protein ABGB16_07055 [Micromonospora sp. B11E3]|uniref:hypothetical protein n=1 Tax=Micromonospora sp. B11E3 TaxID=3153562 RepID=UPI00325F6259
MTEAPVFLGAAADAPQPPAGFGAVVATFHFTSHVELYRSGMLVNDRPNYDIWVPPPLLYVDGQQVRASWSRWWYPLRPGAHDVEVRQPATARRRVEVAAGGLVRLEYRASIMIRKDHTDTQVLQWHNTAKLR